jgi:hypothetical protein
MVVYGIYTHLKKVRHQPLGEPGRAVRHAHVNMGLPVIATVDQNLATVGWANDMVAIGGHTHLPPSSPNNSCCPGFGGAFGRFSTLRL